jgi:hypothetical protein
VWFVKKPWLVTQSQERDGLKVENYGDGVWERKIDCVRKLTSTLARLNIKPHRGFTGGVMELNPPIFDYRYISERAASFSLMRPSGHLNSGSRVL